MDQLAAKLAPVAIEQATKYAPIVLDKGTKYVKDKRNPSRALASAAAINDRAAIRSVLAKQPAANRTPALVVASAAGLLDIIDVLLNTGGPDSSEKTGTTERFRKKFLDAWSAGTTPLLAAVTENHGKTTKLLLDEGADPNIWVREADSALQIAAKGGYLYVMKCLVKYGADVNFKDGIGDTALIVAARYGHSNTSRYLVEHGARVDSRNSKGATALLVAARHDSVEVLDVLLKAGADVNERDRKGKGVLHRAVEGSWHETKTPTGVREEIILTLLDAGADPNAKDREGRTPAQAVRWRKGGGERLRRLLDPGYQSQTRRSIEDDRDDRDDRRHRRTYSF